MKPRIRVKMRKEIQFGIQRGTSVMKFAKWFLGNKPIWKIDILAGSELFERYRVIYGG